MVDQPTRTVTLTLSEDENALIEALARERGLSAPADVLRTLLREAAEIYDALWDKTFADSQDVLITSAKADSTSHSGSSVGFSRCE